MTSPSSHYPSLHELVAEPSKAYLDKFVADYGNAGQLLEGKFVRIGDLVVFAPKTQVEQLPGMQSHSIEHKDIIMAAFSNPNRVFAEQTLKASDAAVDAYDAGDETIDLLDYQSGLVDAGWYLYRNDPPTLRISDRSHDYGSADRAGRTRTIQLIREAVGAGVLTLPSD